MVDNLRFEALVELVDGVCFIGALVADGSFACRLVLIDNAVADFIFIDAKGLGFGDVLTDEKTGDVLRWQMMSHIPSLEFLDSLRFFVGGAVGAGERCTAMGTRLASLVDHRTTKITFDFHVAEISAKITILGEGIGKLKTEN